MPGASNSKKLPLAAPYIVLLTCEILLLGGLVAKFHPAPPLTYELGWVGVASMLAMQVYSLRRRLRVFRNVGSLRQWLDLHIFLGMQGFVFVAYHSVGFSPSPNLAAVSFGLVSVVVASGIVGRYLYGFIPRTRQALAYEQSVATPGARRLPPELRRECHSVVDLIRLDVARRRLLRSVVGDLGGDSALAFSLRHQVAIASRISGLEVADRWFARWTLLHRPLAYLLLGITILHILAHYAYAT